MNLTDLSYEEQAGLPRPRKEVKEFFSREKTYTYIQLLLAEHEKFFNWTTATAMKDRQAYYALANKCVREKGESSLKGILDWGKSKHLHIRQLLKTLSKR